MSDQGVCLALHWLNLIAGPQSSGSLRYLSAIDFKSLKGRLFFFKGEGPFFEDMLLGLPVFYHSR